MARIFLVDIDLSRQQLKNALLHLLGAAPVTPPEGMVYHDTALHKARFWSGTAWVNMDGSSLSPDQLQAMAADLNANGHKVTGLAAPTGGTDAVTKTYVDNVAAGLSNGKPSAKALTNANQAALAGLLVIDGYQTVDGDRLLLVGQAAAAANGVWVAHAGAWTRPVDFASGSVQQGAYVFVEGGDTWANTGWVMNGTANVNVDATAEVWTQFTGTGDIAVTAPLQKVGNTISLTYTPTRKFAATIGDGAATAIAVVHNLGTRDVVVMIQDAASHAEVECDVVMTDVNTVTLTFSVAPAVNADRVVVVG